MGHSKITSNSKKKVYSDIRLPQEARKISNKQPNLTPKVIGKKRTKISINKDVEKRKSS